MMPESPPPQQTVIEKWDIKPTLPRFDSGFIARIYSSISHKVFPPGQISSDPAEVYVLHFHSRLNKHGIPVSSWWAQSNALF